MYLYLVHSTRRRNEKSENFSMLNFYFPGRVYVSNGGEMIKKENFSMLNFSFITLAPAGYSQSFILLRRTSIVRNMMLANRKECKTREEIFFLWKKNRPALTPLLSIKYFPISKPVKKIFFVNPNSSG